MMKLLTTICLTATLATAATAKENDRPDIKQLMSKEEYSATGMHKLTEQEHQALNQWLLRYTANEAPIIRKKSKEVKKVAADTTIKANILPPFKGWEGRTVFRLDNGQVWRQRNSGRKLYRGDDYRVEIKKNVLGFYQMKLLDSGASVGVKRVE